MVQCLRPDRQEAAAEAHLNNTLDKYALQNVPDDEFLAALGHRSLHDILTGTKLRFLIRLAKASHPLLQTALTFHAEQSV
eukprot:5963471-Amphidinium_carterae.1